MVSATPGNGRIGFLGGGQLGRMSAMAARRFGLGVAVFDPVGDGPAAQVADRAFVAFYHDTEVARRFAKACNVVTVEFENVPVETYRTVEEQTRIAPHWRVLHICQNREREKVFLRSGGFPHAKFVAVRTRAEMESAVIALGTPCVLKNAEAGYDGKGQQRIDETSDLSAVWQACSGYAVVEAWVDHACELSVICARDRHGNLQPFPAAENVHSRHILDISIAPARVEPEVLEEAQTLAMGVADHLRIEGLLAVEMFLERSGRLLINELAPRPHNSGHHTIETCATSQFEQHVRAVCGMPLAAPAMRCAGGMVNLLGDLWTNGVPDWSEVLTLPQATLHLYGKSEARPGRKMGHVTVCAETPQHAAKRCGEVKAILRRAAGGTL